MSKCHFTYDFYQDGRQDVLAEVRILQSYGQWTKEKRARWIKQAITCHERVKRTHPERSSYNAGRIAGLKSAITARYPEPSLETVGKTIFLAIGDEKPVFCGSCGDCATWKYYERGYQSSIRYRCDRCKQERVRVETTYTALSGWDWIDHEHALLPLPVSHEGKLVVKEKLQPASIFFPCTSILGLGLLDLSWHVPAPLLILQALFVLHLTVKGEDYLQEIRKLFGLESER